LIEACFPKVQRLTKAGLVDKAIFAEVFRHRDIGDRGWLVVAAAAEQSTREYSVPELVIASAIGALTVWSKRRSQWLSLGISRLAGKILAELEDWYPQWLARQTGITCVELVVRSYVKAGLQIRVTLNTGGEGSIEDLWKAYQTLRALEREQQENVRREQGRGPEPPAAGRVPERTVVSNGGLREEDIAELLGLLADPRVMGREYEMSVAEMLREELTPGIHGGGCWAPGLVTPRQLEESPDLESLGPPSWFPSSTHPPAPAIP
jgi:hypothetical protein